jgi:hypothetical protein
MVKVEREGICMQACGCIIEEVCRLSDECEQRRRKESTGEQRDPKQASARA